MNTIWTADQSDLLRQAWAAGQASADIAALVGYSAAAVRAKRMRLGLPRRSEAVVAVQGLAYRDFNPPPSPHKAPEVVAREPLAGSMPRPWILRDPGECAWPVRGFGDETMSCCLPIEGRGGYCAGHSAIARREPWPPLDPGNVTLFRGR